MAKPNTERSEAPEKPVFGVRPLTEADLDAILVAAGGARLAPDPGAQTERAADYVLHESIIELKSLDEEGLEKPERQAKLAALFGGKQPGKPVVVLDPGTLSEEEMATYYRIMESPIKSAVSSGRKQLKQSRKRLAAPMTGVLLIVNNGYTALSHEEVKDIAAHRCRNDSDEIDGVVVGGCYFVTDGFDYEFDFPIEYVPIREDRPFASYAKFEAAWDEFAERFMTALMIEPVIPPTPKWPVMELSFDVGGTTYVKPAPLISGDPPFELG